MKRLRAGLTYANVVASLALFAALAGGTAFAAAQLEKESVGTKQLKKEAVTPAKLSKGAKAAITGPKGATGAQGPKGDTGARGETGPAGATRIAVHDSPIEAVASGVSNQGEADCLPGEKAIGGGMFWQEAVVKGMVVGETAPLTPGGGPPTGWLAVGSNETGTTKHMGVRVVCASP
jgi:hypothetical protein